MEQSLKERNDPAAFLTAQYESLEQKYKEAVEASNQLKICKTKLLEVKIRVLTIRGTAR